MSRGRSFVATCTVFLIVLPVFSVSAVSFWDDMSDEVLADALLASMSDEEIVAQTLLVGWVGQQPSDEIMSWISTRNLGGVKVFGWNGGDLAGLATAIGAMQRAASATQHRIPLLTATDQEGGWVRHIKGGDELSTFITPGNMAIGASTLPYDAYRSAYFIGLELRALGVNMNFAPTVDVYINPEAHVIGPRAFSDDPVQSGLLGSAFFRGLEQHRIIATAKHFPGHGNASGDSHGVLPIISDTYEQLWARDLVPYRFLIREGVPAILSGHLAFPEISGDGKPASLSSYFGSLLREELGFRGIVMTDDLYMGGAWVYGNQHGWDIGDLVVEAIRAGNDMVLLSQTPDVNGRIWDALLSEYQTDPGFRSRVRAAARTVIQTKIVYLKDDDRVPLYPDPTELPEVIQRQDGSFYFRDQAGRSATIVADGSLPLHADDNRTLLLVGKDPDFLRIGAEFYPEADSYRVTSPSFDSASADEKRFMAALIQDYDTVIFCLSDPATLELLNEVEESDSDIVVLSILTPIYLREAPWVRSAVAVYGWGDESFRAGFSTIRGDIDARGSLPVDVDPQPDQTP